MELHPQVKKFWASELHGFDIAGDSSNSIEDGRAPKTLKETTRLKDGRYKTTLWGNATPC